MIVEFIAFSKKKKEFVHPSNIFLNGSGVVWENKRDGIDGDDNLVSTKDLLVCMHTGYSENLPGGESGRLICDGHRIRIKERKIVNYEWKNLVYEGFVEFDKNDAAFRFSNGAAPEWTYAIREGMIVEIVGHKLLPTKE